MSLTRKLNHIIKNSTYYKITQKIGSMSLGEQLIYNYGAGFEMYISVDQDGNEYWQFEEKLKDSTNIYLLMPSKIGYCHLERDLDYKLTTNISFFINYNCSVEEFFQLKTIYDTGTLSLKQISLFKQIYEKYKSHISTEIYE